MYKRDDYEYREYIYIYISVPNMIGIYIYIGKRNITTTSKMLVYFFLSISVFSLSFFYRHRCSTLIDPPYPLHPATRFERFAARYVKRERVFFPLTSARSPLTSAYRAHTMFYVYARVCVCVYIYIYVCVRVEGEADIFWGTIISGTSEKSVAFEVFPSFPIYETCR